MRCIRFEFCHPCAFKTYLSDFHVECTFVEIGHLSGCGLIGFRTQSAWNHRYNRKAIADNLLGEIAQRLYAYGNFPADLG